MLNSKYYKKIIKLLRVYEYCLDGYRTTTSKHQAEFKLSYKDGKIFSETVWIASDNWPLASLETIYYSIKSELSGKYPYVNQF